MSHLKLIVLGALAGAALALGSGTAEASLTNQTQTWCKPRSLVDQVILDGGGASLIWKADGDLVLQPLNRLVQKIWSSGTAGAGDKLCWRADGTLAIEGAGGATLWSQGGGTVPDPSADPHYYKISLSMSGCSLSAKYVVRVKIMSWPSDVYMTIRTGTLWTRAVACPVVSESVVDDDWCLALPPAGRERPIVETPSSELVWTPDGALVQRAKGIRAGQQIWRAATSGPGHELCFAPTGQLSIFDAQRQPVWSTPAGTTTTSSYLLQLDECDLAIAPVEGAGHWSKQHRCPQSTLPRNTHVPAGDADVVLAESDHARLVFQPDGNLVLRSITGAEVWHSALVAGRGKRASFQTDGNLVIYDGANSPAWSAKIWDSSVTSLVLDGCALKLLAGTTVRWSRGAPTCPSGAITNTPAWSLTRSGNVTLLRTPESRLVWQADGNLVLYTASGAPVWASDTNGVGKLLSFQADGNLVIYGSETNPGPSNAVWSSGTWYTTGPSHALRLGDHCTLTVTDAGSTAAKWTGNDSCTVVNYSFEHREGNDTFGAGMRTHLTAKDNGAARLDSTTGIDITIFGARQEVLSASGYQTEGNTGGDLDTASVTVLGRSTASVNVMYEQTFFEESRTFSVGPVPVVVSAGATGELGLSLSFSGGAMTLTPKAGLYVTVSAGVGAECDLGGASAGVRGQLTLMELALPISLKLSMESGQPRYTVKGDLTLAALSGSLELYAEAYVKLYFVKVSADWSRRLFGWDGVEWSRSLFSKSGGF